MNRIITIIALSLAVLLFIAALLPFLPVAASGPIYRAIGFHSTASRLYAGTLTYSRPAAALKTLKILESIAYDSCIEAVEALVLSIAAEVQAEVQAAEDNAGVRHISDKVELLNADDEKVGIVLQEAVYLLCRLGSEKAADALYRVARSDKPLSITAPHVIYGITHFRGERLNNSRLRHEPYPVHPIDQPRFQQYLVDALKSPLTDISTTAAFNARFVTPYPALVNGIIDKILRESPGPDINDMLTLRFMPDSSTVVSQLVKRIKTVNAASTGFDGEVTAGPAKADMTSSANADMADPDNTGALDAARHRILLLHALSNIRSKYALSGLIELAADYYSNPELAIEAARHVAAFSSRVQTVADASDLKRLSNIINFVESFEPSSPERRAGTTQYIDGFSPATGDLLIGLTDIKSRLSAAP